MPQASGSRHSLTMVKETVFGTTPATPAMAAVRHKSTTLNLNRASFGSEELRADRMIADFRLGARTVEGNVVVELSKGSHDDLLANALCGTWATNTLKAGTVRGSFSMERHFQDIGEYARYTGVQVDTLQIQMTTGAVVEMTFGLWGRDMANSKTQITGATYPSVTTTSPMDALSGTITEGGSAIAVVTEVNLNLNNGLASRFVIGSDVSLEPSAGRSNVTGTLTAFFESSALLQKFLTQTTSSLSVTCSDGTDTYTFALPRIKYTGAEIPVTGEGSVTIALPFQALLDSASGTNFSITRSA